MSDRANSGWEDGERYEDRENWIEAFAAKLKIRVEDAEVFIRNGMNDPEQIPKNPWGRRMMVKYLKKHETPPAKWMVVSGLWPEMERPMPAEDRRRRVRSVYTSAVLLIRKELKRHEVDPNKAERGIYWDPVIEVCRTMEISASKLSGFCKELTGNSLAQVIDNIRAEGLGRKLRAGVREFLKARGATSGTENHSVSRKDAKAQSFAKNGKEEKWGIWEELKAQRKWPEFSRDSWALGMGFGSYRKLYRACLCVFGKTPHQMEMEEISLALEGKEEVVEDRFREWTLEEIIKEIKGIRAVDWELEQEAKAGGG